MAALTSARSTWLRSFTYAILSLPTDYTATEGGAACLDTANAGYVYPAYAGQSTLIPIGQFKGISGLNGQVAGPANVGVELDTPVWCRSYDSVTGSGAVTISNQLQEVYLSSDHEVTTTAGSNGKAGRVWDVNGDGVWVQGPWIGQSAS